MERDTMKLIHLNIWEIKLTRTLPGNNRSTTWLLTFQRQPLKMVKQTLLADELFECV